ncbi:MAG: MBL fold metallo-hydrolase [Chloroflexi bacterium]|nr:MBL fold metallo-hydrolase [Chloroflexota bacterium]
MGLPSSLCVRYIGGPTAVLELGGLRLLTDPTFDPPGDYPIGSRVLTKTAPPSVPPAAIGVLDAVLLSHDQHPDNLDRLGREQLARVPLVLSTASAHGRLGDAVRVLPNWSTVELARPDGGVLRITGVPAQHGPDGTEHLVGEVTGFVLSGTDLPTVYVSGDNASLGVVRAIAERYRRIDVAVIFAGAAQTGLVPNGYLTLTSELAVEAGRLLGAPTVIALHFEGWAHFTQGRDSLRQAFARVGASDALRLPDEGGDVFGRCV